VSGIPITLQLLQKVDSGECFLVEKGLHGCRVRLDGSSVFVSLSEGESGKLLSGPVRAEVIKFFAKINYPKVFLELSERPGILSRY
jgi:hypothetical protein